MPHGLHQGDVEEAQALGLPSRRLRGTHRAAQLQVPQHARTQGSQMLKLHKTIKTEDGFLISDELEDDPCTICGGESVPNICKACKRSTFHHHGRVHVIIPPSKSHELAALCTEHAQELQKEKT